ncbi:efflux RND transporter periplasmic adaptor subunit [Albibacterium bauzanense]|uniref:RND family efflux transporter MFP subunit n=1 Tax=Albibacterium bauzanense TaxID=653929 RepID=A0A4R1M1W4_9SPHI|nr:efflux RND transporter periplasmic adaptor subunit [Albibacterium bauzanense]TCK83623.1 RND family efflux transporter MFP subunit [Albibacterium bauzanense]
MRHINFNKYMKVLYFIPFILLINACGNEKPVAKDSQKKQLQSVQIVRPVEDQAVYLLELPGELKAFEQVVLYPKVKGFVKQLFVDRGSNVHRGQLLALLEAPEITQQYLSAKADENKFYQDYQYSRQSYERLKRAAARSGAVAEIELDRASSKFRSDSAAYASVKAKTGASAQLQQYLKITAPFDGIITDRNVSVGALVGEGTQTSLFSLSQTKDLRLTVAIPEKHGPSLSKNTKVSFTVAGHPGKVYPSVLSRKSGVLDQQSRSITAEFDVSNSRGDLSGGDYAQVKLSLQRPVRTLWLPTSSVVNAQSGIFVVKIDQNRVFRVPVTLGIRNGELQEVFGELSQEDEIVKSASEELTEGMKIVIK